jgi:hypothetical protein
MGEIDVFIIVVVVTAVAAAAGGAIGWPRTPSTHTTPTLTFDLFNSKTNTDEFRVRSSMSSTLSSNVLD